ncbi:MAG: hypothetical protein A2Y31_07215 [Spirochaetes bacterium GWC2_52_13]|nr:MAG: hypothetical protein A2Y31_07215 [Spirochaetes bacterium GWC2_52_13]HCG62814.1 hypothetical protein [Sphaerochaeta sp.]
MNDLIINLLRGSVSSVMNVILLFTLTRSKFGRNGTIVVATSVFAINMASTIWFYVHGDLTALSKFDIIMFLVVGLALKPMTRLSFMQWSFTFLTTLNIMMMIIFLSFDWSRSLPMPPYANTFLRLVLYIAVIFLFKKYLRLSYESVVNNWPIFSVLVVCIFLNLSYYFYATDDIQKSLTVFRWPLYLLVTLSLAAYGTVFYSLKKIMAMYALETENLKIQNESGLLHQAAIKLEKYANYDTLTGLPNRRFFFERLDQVVAESESNAAKFALLYIDLDGFKDINDNYGHEVGDGVLVTVGDRLLKCIRKTDIVARLGGDEFAIIFRDIEDMEIAKKLTGKIHTMLQETISMGTIECAVNSSIGIAVYPDTGKYGETLVRNADSAMYEVKRNGKGGIGFFKDTPYIQSP